MLRQPHQVDAMSSFKLVAYQREVHVKKNKQNRAVLLNFQGDRASSGLESERMHFRKQKQEQK